ncbi:PepSY domain-containing protein, partial [Sinorhizobium medicae]
KVRSFKTEDGCYEAYAINAEGRPSSRSK